MIGDYLNIKKELTQAILSYESAGAYEKALETSKSLMDTKKAIKYAKLLKFDELKIINLYEEILENALENGNHS